MLPPKVRTEVEHKMTDRAFSGYRQLAEELQAQGYKISDDSLQRYGAKLRHDLETIRLANHHARMVGEAAPDPKTMLDSIARMAQLRLLSALMEEDKQLDAQDLALLRLLFARERWTQQAAAVREPAATERPAKGEGGLSTPVYNAMRNMLVGEYIDQPAPDSGLTVEEHRKIREGLAETGVLIPMDLDDPRRLSDPAKKPDALPAPSEPLPGIPQPSVSSLPPKPIAPPYAERPSPQIAAQRPVPPPPPNPPVWCPRIRLPPRGF
jgi:hypothetical protein